MLAQEGAVFGPLGGCGILLVLRLGPLQLGKAHRRGGVAQEDGQRDGSRERDAGRKPEAPTPGPRMGGSDAHVAHDVAAENHHQSGANRVRGVPPRHLRGQLGGGHPVGQQPRAGREARPLQHAVDHPHDAHEEYHRVGELRAVVFARKPVGDIFAESEGEVREGAERQTDGHVPAGVHAVGQHAVDEAREAIDHSVERQEDAQTRLGDAEVGLQTGHRKREVLAHEVEERVAHHRGDDGARLPVLEALFLFGCHFGMKVFRFQ